MHNFQLGLERRRIEDRITQLADTINFDQRDARWLDAERFWDFIYAWHDLTRYYERSQDTTVGAHLLKLYMRCAVLLRNIMQDRDIHSTRRERAQAALMELNYQVDAMIVQVERNAANGNHAAVGRLG